MNATNESLPMLRVHVSRALWDDGDKGKADEALSALVERVSEAAEIVRQLWEYVADDGAEEAALRAIPGLAQIVGS